MITYNKFIWNEVMKHILDCFLKGVTCSCTSLPKSKYTGEDIQILTFIWSK